MTSNKYKLLSLSNLSILFYHSLPFFGKNVVSLIFGYPLIRAAGSTFQKFSHLEWRVSNFLLERGDKLEKVGWM